MDDSFAANQTMIKLINAAKRGVNCVVMCDDLNQNIKKDLSKDKISTSRWENLLPQQNKLVEFVLQIPDKISSTSWKSDFDW